MKWLCSIITRTSISLYLVSYDFFKNSSLIMRKLFNFAILDLLDKFHVTGSVYDQMCWCHSSFATLEIVNYVSKCFICSLKTKISRKDIFVPWIVYNWCLQDDKVVELFLIRVVKTIVGLILKNYEYFCDWTLQSPIGGAYNKLIVFSNEG